MASIELHNDIVAQQRTTFGSMSYASHEYQLSEKYSDTLKPRIRWIDSARGFVVFFCMIFIFAPDLDNSISDFFTSGSPLESRYMNAHDVGAPLFLFVIGLSMPLSIWSRVNKKGRSNAVIMSIIRCLLFIILGMCGSIVAGNYPLTFIVATNGISVLKWNLVTAIGLSMLVALPVVFIELIYIRLLLAYLWIILYQMLSIYFEYFREYAKASVAGMDTVWSFTGIFVSFFIYPFFIVIGSVITDYIFNNQYGQNQSYQLIHFLKHGNRKKYFIVLLFGIINFVAGTALSYVPNMYISRQEGSFTFNIICISICILLALTFVVMDQVLNWEGYFMKYLQILGFYTALTITIFAVFMGFVFLLWYVLNEDDIILWVGILLGVIMVSIVDLCIYKKRKTVKTEIVLAIPLVVAIAGIVIRLILKI